MLIQKYLGFIRAEMVKAVRRPQNGYEDEESIAMFAFYEAILNYEKGRGRFSVLRGQSDPQQIDRLLSKRTAAPESDFSG